MKRPEAQDAAALTLFDPRRGDVSFKVETLRAKNFQTAQRFNYFSILWIQKGHGAFHLDLLDSAFHGPALLFVNPYQTLFLTPKTTLAGMVIQFHANFFCIEAHHEKVGCNGVLFNDIYGPPLVCLQETHSLEIQNLIGQMKAELGAAGLAHSEILLSYLKVFLIKATRRKVEQQNGPSAVHPNQKPFVLKELSALIEQHYPSLHSPADYAGLLHITAKALGKIVKTHFGKTLTRLIRERILKHAKWQLLHTRKPVKEIAACVGFADELYFSRLFRRETGFAPTDFRKFETAIRNGSNLSM